MFAKCPKCEKIVSQMGLKVMQASGLGVNTLNAVVYTCPNPQCQTILGVQADPLAMITDTAKRVKKELGVR